MIKKYVNQNYPKTLFAVSLICVGNMLGTLTAAAAPTDSPYMPGTILETERTLADSQVLFDHSGNYTISNTNNNTLQINAGSSGLLKVDNGETIVVNGNIKINQQGFSQSFWSGYDQVANGGKLIVNGDFYWDQTWDGSTWYNLRENFNVKGVADFNGKLTIINDVGTIGGTTSQTTLNAVGGTVNVNGDAYIYNKVGNYISSGANAVYSMNGGIINFNGEKTRIMAVSNQPDSISAKNDTNHPFSKTQVNINSQTTQILGSIDIAGFGQVNAVLTGRESYWYGGEKNAGYWIFPTTGVLNVTVKDGAEWGYFGDHTHYAQGKGLTALILENGGIVNMYDDYLQQKWRDYGLDKVYAIVKDVKHDYVYFGDLKGQDGIFQLDLDSTNKSNSDMIYIKASSAGAGSHSIQAYANDDFTNISAENTLRFATVGSSAADKIKFNDSVNIYGKTLWDYKLLIGSEDYDVNNPENAVYNDKIAGNTVVGGVPGSGAKNWFIYGYEKKPTENAQSLLTVNDAVYAAWISNNDTLRQRLGELDFNTDNQGLWARIYGGKLNGEGLSHNYRTYQLGYDAVFADKNGTQNGVWYGGTSFEYTKGSTGYKAGSGDLNLGAVALYATQKGAFGDNLDIVLKHGKLKGNIDTFGRITDSGDFDTSGTSLSLEYNKRLPQKNGLFLEPQVQLTVGHIKSTNYTTKSGINVNQAGMNSSIARLGFLVGKDFEQGNVYLKASVLHEFGGKGSVRMMDNEGLNNNADKDYSGSWFELGLGTNWQTGKNHHLYVDVERSFGGKFEKKWQVNAGMNWMF